MDALEQLLLAGKIKTVHLTAIGNQYDAKKRLEGYKVALAKYNIPFNQELVISHEDKSYLGSNLVFNSVDR